MRYLVTKRPHYINNRMVQPGEVVTLPEGVSPGKLLKPYSGKAETSSAPAPQVDEDDELDNQAPVGAPATVRRKPGRPMKTART